MRWIQILQIQPGVGQKSRDVGQIRTEQYRWVSYFDKPYNGIIFFFVGWKYFWFKLLICCKTLAKAEFKLVEKKQQNRSSKLNGFIFFLTDWSRYFLPFKNQQSFKSISIVDLFGLAANGNYLNDALVLMIKSDKNKKLSASLTSSVAQNFDNVIYQLASFQPI